MDQKNLWPLLKERLMVNMVFIGGNKVLGIHRDFWLSRTSNHHHEGSTQGKIVVDNEVGTTSMIANFLNNTGSLPINTALILIMKTILLLIRQMVRFLWRYWNYWHN